MRRGLSLACWVLAVGLLVAHAAWAGVTTRVSVSSEGAQGNNASGYYSGVCCNSTDGRYVAFESSASNLVPGDTDGYCDVFVHDRQTGQTTRVSVSSDRAQGNSGSFAPSISGDGRYVAFCSGASNLVPGDTDGYWDVFVHDRQTGQTDRVSVSSDGTQGNSDSRFPSISADGQYVAFCSYASNLVPGDANGCYDAFVHDRETGRTERVSVSRGGAQGNLDSWIPSISADGRYVAFYSDASNLVAGDTNGYVDAFVHDRQTGQTEMVSISSSGAQGNAFTYSTSISADGRFVALYSYASNLVPGDTNGESDIFVHDRQTGQTERVSVSSDGTKGNSGSWGPSISGDGRYVAFHSYASDRGTDDVFVHDRQTGQTERVSVSSSGAEGNGYSSDPSISADGRYVAFRSDASNLVPGDTNGTWDVFVRDRGSGSLPDLTVTEFTLTPPTLEPGSDVAARIVAPGAVSASLRVTGLLRDLPSIPTHWDGQAFTATISGSQAVWSEISPLFVWATVSDGLGRTGTACRLLLVPCDPCPTNTGDPNAVCVKDCNALGVLTGKVKEILSASPPLEARISMDTAVKSLLGVDGPMNIWPAVIASGVPVEPAADYSLGALLARLGRFSPSGGPAYDVTFGAVGDKAIFSAHFDVTALLLHYWDMAARLVAVGTGVQAPSAADIVQTYAAFAELTPVKNAAAHFNPWPSGWRLVPALAQAAYDMKELVRNPYERATLKTILEELIGEKIVGWAWLKTVAKVFDWSEFLKMQRDIVKWHWITRDGDPVIVFEAVRESGGWLAVSSAGATGLIRPDGIEVSFDLVEASGSENYVFTLKNVAGSSLWEWRVELDGDQPQPTAVSAPAGWKSDIVWSLDERCVRWWTEGPNGWAAGDYGSSSIPEGSSLSGFSFTLPYRLQQCAFTATATDQRMDGGMLSMIPALSAAPPDFAPTEGETTELVAYLDRPATVTLKVFCGGSEYATVSGPEPRPAGEFTADWDGSGPGGPAPPGDYEARMHAVYADASTADLSTPLKVVTGLLVDSTGELHSLPDGRSVRLEAKVATAAFASPACIYVEEPSRCAGVKVLTSRAVSEGDVLSISGAVLRVDGELAITDATVETVYPGGPPLAPLGLPSRSLGGGPFGTYPSGITGASGLGSIGLLVRTWGRIVQRDQSWFTIDDGSGVSLKCLLPSGVTLDPGWSFVGVTGISSCEGFGVELHRLLRVRTQGDFTPF